MSKAQDQPAVNRSGRAIVFAGLLLTAVNGIVLIVCLWAFVGLIEGLSGRVDPEGLIAPLSFGLLGAGIQILVLLPLAFVFRATTRGTASPMLRHGVLWMPIIGLLVSAASGVALFTHDKTREQEFKRESEFYSSGLDEAIRSDDAVLVATILDGQPDLVGRKDIEGREPLGLAAELGSVRVAEILLQRGASPDASLPPFNVTPMHRAAQAGHMAVVRILVEWGANPGATDFAGRTPADVATKEGHDDLAKFLRQRLNQPKRGE